MNAIIFSVSAGCGHISAAKAVKNYILHNNPNSVVKIIDTYKYINPIINKVLIGGYLKSLEINPSLFGKLYDYTDNNYKMPFDIGHEFNKLMVKKLLPLIHDFNPDILIATHPFSTEMISILKSKYRINVPTVSILTDYVTHSAWHHSYIDSYIVSNKDMINDMSLKGINKNIIHDFGIPVRPNFIQKFDKNITLKELKLSTSKKTVLIMGGSLGIGNIEQVYKNLCSINENIQIIVITGKNKNLYNKLIKLKVTSKKETHIIGFTNEVNKYMQISDVLITKPGGLTITEALISKIPMALFSPIPGVETKNADFLLKHNLAVTIDDGYHCADIIENLLNNKNNKLEIIKNNIDIFSKPNAGQNIYSLLNSLVKINKSAQNYNSLERVTA